jgi:hypothetical protein
MTGSSRSALWPILTGGLIAGTLDILQACILFGWDIPLAVAAGLLGKQAFHGGAGTYLLGLALHYFIATTATAIYYFVSGKLTFLAQNWVVCGIFFGMAVELVMSLVVLPLSALHARGPYQLHDLLLGLGMHMLTIGLPIAFIVFRFSRSVQRAASAS